MTTIFEKIGGHDQLEKMVAQFYQFILTDERINYFFLENVSDIPKLHSTMVQFLTFLFGGPNHYKGPNMVKLHENMPIKQIHFDITWEHMESAFLIFKIPKELIAEMKELVYALQGDIVTIKSWSIIRGFYLLLSIVLQHKIHHSTTHHQNNSFITIKMKKFYFWGIFPFLRDFTQ